MAKNARGNTRMMRFPHNLALRKGYNFRWHFDWPWDVVTYRAWFFKSWNQIGERMEDSAPVSHRGWRILGIRRDEWFVHFRK